MTEPTFCPANYPNNWHMTNVAALKLNTMGFAVSGRCVHCGSYLTVSADRHSWAIYIITEQP